MGTANRLAVAVLALNASACAFLTYSPVLEQIKLLRVELREAMESTDDPAVDAALERADEALATYAGVGTTTNRRLLQDAVDAAIEAIGATPTTTPELVHARAGLRRWTDGVLWRGPDGT